MRKTLALLGLLVTTTVLPWLGGGGCSSTVAVDNSGETEVVDEPLSLLETDHGGYTPEDESQGFGLATMSQFVADEVALDPSVTPDDEAAAEADPEAQVYMVRIVWGNLELNAREELSGEEETNPISWDGSLSYQGAGTLLVKRTILFEKGDLILDEADTSSIAWESVTGPHVDGILAKLIVIPGKDLDTLTFSTKALEHTIALADLDRHNEVLTLDEEGHGVAFTAIRVDDNGDCAEGFLEGKYHDRTDGHAGGVFRGRALTDEGALEGHLRGHYGVNDEGDSLFFGKYIDEEGLFRGFFQGVYGEGSMEGDWIYSNETIGTLKAAYVQGEAIDSGFFQGYWAESCE